MTSVVLQTFDGAGIRSVIADLARLRLTVFETWPYLYDGDLAYEEDYLREFLEAQDSVLIAACADGCIVGAATASPMYAQKAEIRAPFEQRGMDTNKLFYFGESVLLPSYRGRRLGHAFFDHREAHARRCGASAATFAAVIREEDHPSRPPGYVPLDAFWRKRGYVPEAGVVTALAWKEHGESEESPKSMQYWMRAL